MTESKPRCIDCIFVSQDTQGYSRTCRYNPPTVYGNGQSGWPYVGIDYWCGKFEAAEKGASDD